MNKTDIEKNCKNCKYFVTHYILVGTKFLEAGGHCKNEALFRFRDKNLFVSKSLCKYWEMTGNKIDNAQKSIEQVLREMESHLFCIKNILDKTHK